MRDVGISSDKVVLFGGGAKSRLWRQIIADILSTKIVTLNIEEGPAYGVALLAGVRAGIYGSVEQAVDRTIREVDQIEPIREDVEKYKKIYEVYKSLYRDLKEDFRISNILC